ncbi:MAG TPA: PQQ-binding-like beta-propeller repeat protein [Pirellulaceae bacterium]|nr:PQQ-binding-like beta-propeller repeat protein [Pirellulaceae bacterium]HMO90834.1 PQQ-binding-like beta-propeller repeat protein [Pirellulaceae bacterium]HMP68085.1 PQQ-binding-like beta-propeller repeat protein [Pirellulaceae bacterium]
MKKLQEKVDTAGRSISGQAIASYLIKKQIIDQAKAQEWISRCQAIFAPQEELVANAAGQRESHDTMDLIGSMAGPPTQQPLATRDLADDGEGSGGDDLHENQPNTSHSRQRSASDKVTSKRKAKSVAIERVEDVDDVVELGADQLVADDVLNNAGFDPFAEPGEQQGEKEEAAAIDTASMLYSFGRKKRYNQWVSKWPLIGSGVLLFLIITGAIIWRYLFSISADQLFEMANDHYSNLSYAAALKDYNRFIEGFPKDDRVSIAKVRVVNCELRMPFDGRDWDTVLERVKTRVPTVVDEPSFSDMHEELAVILPGTADGYALKGRGESSVEGKQRYLALTDEVLGLVNRPEYIPSSQRQRDVVANIIESAENNKKILAREIRMELTYADLLNKVDELVAQRKTNDAFELIRTTARDFPEIEVREPLLLARKKIGDKESELVASFESDVRVLTSEPKSFIDASIVLATKSGQGIEDTDELITYLVDGTVYGLSARDGEIRWQRFISLPSLMQPQWLNTEKSDLIVVDQLEHSILRLSSRDGSIIWRSVIGKPFSEPLIDNQVLAVTTFDGELIQVDVNSGSAEKGVKLPQRLETSAASADRYPYYYQAGSHSNLYVISKQSLQCEEVVYFGHKPGNIKAAPFFFSEHLLVPINGDGYCNLHVLRTTDNGLRLEVAQAPIRLNGRVVSPIFRYRRWAIVMTDRGDLRMLEVNLSEEDMPISTVASANIEISRDLKNYIYGSENHLYVTGKGIVRYRIQRTSARFDRQDIANTLDEFIASPLQVGDSLYHMRRRMDSAMVSVSCVDPVSMEEKWRRDFSAPLAGKLVERDGRLYGLNSQGDLFEFDDATSSVDGATQVMRASNQVQDLLFNQFVSLADGTYAGFSPENRRALVSIDFGKRVPANLLRWEESITAPTSEIIPMGKHVLVPTERGQVYRVDPATGRSVGAPFQPALTAQARLQWRRPVVLDGSDKFFIAESTGRMFLIQAEADRALKKLSEMEYSLPIVSQAMHIDQNVYVVARGEVDDRILVVSVDSDLRVVNEFNLSGKMVSGPFQVGDFVMIKMEDGNLYCFSKELRQLWSYEITDDKLAGAPVYANERIMFVFESGEIKMLDANSGQTINQVSVGRPLSGTPVLFKGKWYVNGLDGIVFRLTESLD